MFFTKAGFVIAWLAFIPSAIAYGIVLAFMWTGNAELGVEMFGNRYFASSGSYLQGIAVGIAFGIASEISSNIAAMRSNADNNP
jgi:hypothetical protein